VIGACISVGITVTLYKKLSITSYAEFSLTFFALSGEFVFFSVRNRPSSAYSSDLAHGNAGRSGRPVYSASLYLMASELLCRPKKI